MENFLTKINHSEPDYQAYSLLRVGFIVAPLLAGLDKFFNYLTDWTQYLAPIVPKTLNMSASSIMMAIGVVEIIVALGVALKPKIFGYVVSAWMIGIIINLFILGSFYDVALRDLGLAIGSFALSRLAVRYDVSDSAKSHVQQGHLFKRKPLN